MRTVKLIVDSHEQCKILVGWTTKDSLSRLLKASYVSRDRAGDVSAASIQA